MPTFHRESSRVFRLSSQGMNQAQIAAETGLSQPTVSRILSDSAPDDPDGVFADFGELARQAQIVNTLDGYRNVHSVALTCHQNGYDVPWHCLPYLMLLSAAVVDAGKRERNQLRKEISQVYQDMKDHRDQN